MTEIDLSINTDLVRTILTRFIHTEISRTGLSRAVVNLSGGVLAANLMDDVGTWKTYVLTKFVQHLGWKVS